MASKNKYMILVSLGYVVTNLSMEKNSIIENDSIIENYVNDVNNPYKDMEEILKKTVLSLRLQKELIQSAKNEDKLAEQKKKENEFFLIENESSFKKNEDDEDNEDNEDSSYMRTFLNKFGTDDSKEYCKYLKNHDYLKSNDFTVVSTNMTQEERERLNKDTTQEPPASVSLTATLYHWFYKK